MARRSERERGGGEEEALHIVGRGERPGGRDLKRRWNNETGDFSSFWRPGNSRLVIYRAKSLGLIGYSVRYRAAAILDFSRRQ